MSKKNVKQKKITSRQLIISTKPSFWYYLLIVFFPILFFLVDNSFNIFDSQWKLDQETLLSVMILFLCFGVPLILFLTRREIKLYEDRLILHWPSLNKTKEYNMEDLNKWEYLDFYVQNAGQQKHLDLWFNDSRKISIHEIQSNEFKKLVDYFERNYSDKKNQRESLGDRLFKWMKNK